MPCFDGRAAHAAPCLADVLRRLGCACCARYLSSQHWVPSRALRRVWSIVAGEAQKADDMQEACPQQLVPDVYMR